METTGAVTGREGEFLTLCDDPLEAVIAKLEQSAYADQFRSRTDMVNFARILSSVSHLKDTYLNTRWAKTVETVRIHISIS